MKNIIASLLLLACAQASFGQLSGPLSGTLGPGTYDVVGNIWVEANDTLRLMPGTTFLFGEDLVFDIYGTLLAEGTESDSIIFTAVEDTTYWPPPWGGMGFGDPGSSGSQLVYCSLTYAAHWSGGAVRCIRSSPTLTNCSLSLNYAHNGGAVLCDSSSSPLFIGCTIRVNGAYEGGGGVYIDNNSAPIFMDCIIRENAAAGEWWWGFGGGIYCDHSSPIFVNCHICDNAASWSSGGAACYSSSVTFLNCVFSENVGWADTDGVICGRCSGIFGNCTFSGNGGEAMFLSECSLLVANTIVTFSGGRGIRFENSPQTQVRCCDFFGNGGGAFGGDVPAGLGVLVATNANGDSCDVYQNILLDPMFVNMGVGDYHLTDSSRCIGAGDLAGAPTSDMDGNPRPNPPGSNPDIGAYENARDVPLHTRYSLPYLPVTHALHPSFPNPFNASTMIRYDVGRSCTIELTIFNLVGQKIQTLANGRHPAGSNIVRWDARDLPSGLYFCRMQASGFIQTQKLMLVK
ncbi:MAG: right-handed parallel beta-helix repeat-containing protein [bacterium]